MKISFNHLPPHLKRTSPEYITNTKPLETGGLKLSFFFFFWMITFPEYITNTKTLETGGLDNHILMDSVETLRAFYANSWEQQGKIKVLFWCQDVWLFYLLYLHGVCRFFVLPTFSLFRLPCGKTHLYNLNTLLFCVGATIWNFSIFYISMVLSVLYCPDSLPL